MAKSKDVKSDKVLKLEQAEELLLRVNREERELSLEELQFLSFDLAWDQRRVRHELGRCRKIVQHQAIAGTSEDRLGLEQALDDAEVSLEKDGEPIRRQIEDLQAKLASMESKVSSLKKRRGQVADSLVALEGYCPEHVEDFANKNRALIRRTFFTPVAELENEVKQLEAVVDRSKHRDDFSHICAVQRYAREAVVPGSNAQHGHPEFSNEWPEVRENAQRRLVEARQELAKAQAVLDSHLEENKASLRCYWR